MRQYELCGGKRHLQEVWLHFQDLVQAEGVPANNLVEVHLRLGGRDDLGGAIDALHITHELEALQQ